MSNPTPTSRALAGADGEPPPGALPAGVLASVLDALESAVLVVNDEGRVVHANHAGHRLLAGPGQSLHGRPVLDLVDERSRADLAALVSSSRHGERHDATCVLSGAPAEARRARIGAAPLAAGSGTTATVLTIIPEEPDRAASAMAADQGLLEASPDCIKLLSPDATLVYLNSAGQRLMEVDDAGAVYGHSWVDWWPGESRALAAEAVEQAQAGRVGRFRGMRPTMRGTRKWWDVSVTPLHASDGRLEQLLCVSRDVTAVKDAEDALRESHRRIETLLANLPGAAYRCRNDATWTMEVISEGITGITGYRPDEMVGNRVVAYGSLVHQDDYAGIVDAVNAAVESHEPFCTTYRLITRAGVERTVWESGRPVYDEQGQFVALEGFITDVTEQNVLEAQLRQAQRMEAVGQLAGGIAHDFNNLLTVIQTYAEFLLEQVGESGPLRNDVLEIKNASLRAASLTRQLLAFSRKQILQPKVLEVGSVLAGLEPMLRRLIAEDVRVEMRVDPATGRVRADPGQLEQVILNLAVNARDAMPEGGELRMSTSNVEVPANASPEEELAPGRYVRLRVTDTGCGMDEATLARIFEPFFTTKPIGQGTGLGLSTVYGIVKQSEGHIRCRSVVGGGTTFDIHLPRVDDGDTIPAAADAAPVTGGRETILLVEDDAAVRSLARRILQRSGYTVLDAAHGAQAMSVAEQHPGAIDLLVTDVVMPEMGGRDLYQCVRTVRPTIRVLYISGYTEDRGARDPVELQASDHLDKPFTTAELASAVRKSLDRRPVNER